MATNLDKLEDLEVPDYLNAEGEYLFKITSAEIEEKDEDTILTVNCETVEKTPKITSLRYNLTKSKEGKIWGKIWAVKLIKAACTKKRLETIQQTGIDWNEMPKALKDKQFYATVKKTEPKVDNLTGETTGTVYYNIDNTKLRRVDENAD